MSLLYSSMLLLLFLAEIVYSFFFFLKIASPFNIWRILWKFLIPPNIALFPCMPCIFFLWIIPLLHAASHHPRSWLIDPTIRQLAKQNINSILTRSSIWPILILREGKKVQAKKRSTHPTFL